MNRAQVKKVVAAARRRVSDTSNDPVANTVGSSPPMSRAQVTSLLTLIGITIGFVFGTALLAALQVGAPGGFHWSIDVPFGMIFGGTFGAIVGGLGAPTLGWLLLRRVPLGRAILWTTVATIASALLGILVAGRPVTGALTGFALAPLVLWVLHRRPTA
jgi:hypothetical protein